MGQEGPHVWESRPSLRCSGTNASDKTVRGLLQFVSHKQSTPSSPELRGTWLLEIKVQRLRFSGEPQTVFQGNTRLTVLV